MQVLLSVGLTRPAKFFKILLICTAGLLAAARNAGMAQGQNHEYRLAVVTGQTSTGTSLFTGSLTARRYPD